MVQVDVTCMHGLLGIDQTQCNEVENYRHEEEIIQIWKLVISYDMSFESFDIHRHKGERPGPIRVVKI